MAREAGISPQAVSQWLLARGISSSYGCPVETHEEPPGALRRLVEFYPDEERRNWVRRALERAGFLVIE